LKRVAAVVAVLALAGCGGTAERKTAPKQPRLSRDLAHSWAQQADQVAAAIAAGDGCTAQQLAGLLHAQFISAVNERRVPRRLQEPLGSAINDLQSRIVCAPVTADPRERARGDKWDRKNKDKPGRKNKHDRGRDD
jgi:hypothetical protein